MLTIRREQIRIFQLAAEQQFLARLASHLSTLTGVPLPELSAAVPVPVADARRFGLLLEKQIARYCEALVLATGQFRIDAVPKAARNLLLSYGVAAEERLTRFEQCLRVYQSEQEELRHAKRFGIRKR